MTNLLDERIDCQYGLDIWAQSRTLFHGPRYQGIANTIVQLIRRSTSGVIAPSQPIRSDERHVKNRLARTVWTPADYAKWKYLRTNSPP